MKKLYLYFAIAAAGLWQCTEEKDWREPTDGNPPGTVTNVRVENFNGGAKITYTPPADNDLLAVKAVYSFKDGDETKSAWASTNKHEIVLEGFADTLEHTVTLCAVDKSMNESTPTEVKIRPKISPVDMVRKTLRLYSTFGGVYITWNNEQEALIDISVSIPDEGGQYRLGERYYSSARVGKYTFRGYSDEPTKFRVHVRDRWNNYAAAYDTVITPIYEE